MTGPETPVQSSLSPLPRPLAQSLPTSVVNGAPGPAVGPGERHLLAAIERVARAPGGWSAIALHLSRLTPPAPQPHHRRVARAVMQDAAIRGEGQVFSLRNGDVVLLARDAEQPPHVVSDRLRRLFGREVGNVADLVSEWRLPGSSPELLAYTAERLREPDAAAGTNAEASSPPAETVDAVAAAIAGARPQDIVQRQVGVLFDQSGSGGGDLRACYRELTFSIDVLESRLPARMRPGQDTALLLHLGRYLDQRMLQVLRLELGSRAPLDIGENVAFALHLNFSLPGVLSDAFATLADQCRSLGRPLGVEISIVEAIAQPYDFARAAARLRGFGARLVLDGVSHLALLVSRPALLGADAIKLIWSPRMADLPEEERVALARAIEEADPARVILQRAETEAAVRWGLAHGIRTFQGRQIDHMLAARRMLGCPMAANCTPRQCTERAWATGGAGRASCANLPLLDAALPSADGDRLPTDRAVTP